LVGNRRKVEKVLYGGIVSFKDEIRRKRKEMERKEKVVDNGSAAVDDDEIVSFFSRKESYGLFE